MVCVRGDGRDPGSRQRGRQAAAQDPHLPVDRPHARALPVGGQRPDVAAGREDRVRDGGRVPRRRLRARVPRLAHRQHCHLAPLGVRQGGLSPLPVGGRRRPSSRTNARCWKQPSQYRRGDDRSRSPACAGSRWRHRRSTAMSAKIGSQSAKRPR